MGKKKEKRYGTLPSGPELSVMGRWGSVVI
jgi:hypothetical protein